MSPLVELVATLQIEPSDATATLCITASAGAKALLGTTNTGWPPESSFTIAYPVVAPSGEGSPLIARTMLPDASTATSSIASPAPAEDGAAAV